MSESINEDETTQPVRYGKIQDEIVSHIMKELCLEDGETNQDVAQESNSTS